MKRAISTLIGSPYTDEEIAGGVAYRGGQFNVQRFSVARYRGYQDGVAPYRSYLFAHEIGHNLGAAHNREQYESNGQGIASTFSYAFGYLIKCTQYTIMSYGSECWRDERVIPHFSNPSISYDGYRTGIPATRDDSAFVAKAFENNRHVAVEGRDNEFRYEEVRYLQGEFDRSTGGACRYVRLYNDTRHPIVVDSRTYVKPDGTETTYSANLTINAGETRWAIVSCSSSAQHLFGTTYTGTYFHYNHPITGVTVKSPIFPWLEIYTDHSELRIAYTDGGRPTGHTRRYLLPGASEDVIFEPDRGFSIAEIKSTCEGNAIADGFRVSATIDPCIVEASFSDDRTPPAKPIITDIQAGDGVASISVSVPDDGGADLTAISATCTFGSNTYSGASASSPVSVGGMINGQTYECFTTATNLKGTGAASDTISVTLPQTMPSEPTLTRADNGDGEVYLFVSDSGQPTTVDSYTATCTDGTNTFTGTSTSSPITVSGLTNDVAYTCTVTATNSVGTSSASAATAPITPEEASTGLPIWLLYQATQ